MCGRETSRCRLISQQGRETHRQSAATIPLVPHREQKPSLSKKHIVPAGQKEPVCMAGTALH